MYESLSRIGVAAHAAFARDDKTADDLKTLDHATRIMVALRNQAPFKKGGASRLRDLLSVKKVVNSLEMPQREWAEDLRKRSLHRSQNTKGTKRAGDLCSKPLCTHTVSGLGFRV